ncbi:MAG: hypothetical protein MZV65_13255 [Chromatiales bacterium]|nr:hypothetical protein [Chromatiales bacterium]
MRQPLLHRPGGVPRRRRSCRPHNAICIAAGAEHMTCRRRRAPPCVAVRGAERLRLPGRTSAIRACTCCAAARSPSRTLDHSARADAPGDGRADQPEEARSTTRSAIASAQLRSAASSPADDRASAQERCCAGDTLLLCTDGLWEALSADSWPHLTPSLEEAVEDMLSPPSARAPNARQPERHQPALAGCRPTC